MPDITLAPCLWFDDEAEGLYHYRGPHFTFNEAVSLQVLCDTQDEVDHYWEKLGEDGDPQARQCGWLKDRFGVSWQVIPRGVKDLVASPDSEGSRRASRALLRMEKLDLAELQRAYDGKAATAPTGPDGP